MEKVKDIFSKIINWVKSHLILLVAIIAVVLVVVVVANLFIKSPKKVVKAYIKAYNSGNASKMIKLSDLKAQRVLSSVSKKFDKDNYEKFKDKYDDYDKDIDKDDIKENLEETFEERKNTFKSFKIKVKEITDVKKVTKDFYVVTARVYLEAKPKKKDADEMSTTSTMYFGVYKNKMATAFGSPSSYDYDLDDLF